MAITDSIMDTLNGTITVAEFRSIVNDWYEVRNKCENNSVLEGAILDAFDSHDESNIKFALCEYVDVVYPWGEGKETPFKKAINEFDWVELTADEVDEIIDNVILDRMVYSADNFYELADNTAECIALMNFMEFWKEQFDSGEMVKEYNEGKWTEEEMDMLWDYEQEYENLVFYACRYNIETLESAYGIMKMVA